MPAKPPVPPKGNKYALGCETSGRPRTTCPPPEELIKLGKELVQWATEETDELRCRFPQFYSLKKGILASVWDLIIDKPEFSLYYEQARIALSRRFIDGSVNQSIAHRFLPIYIPEIRKMERKIKEEEVEDKKSILDHDHKNKTEVLSTVPEELQQQYIALMTQITTLQSSNLNLVDKSKSKDK
jgi:hypothetical protein